VHQAAQRGEHEIAWMLPIALWDLFSLRGHWRDWIATHQTALASARLLGNREAETWILSHLGSGLLHSGQCEAAVPHLQRCVLLMRQMGVDGRAVAISQHNLGLALLEVGRFGEARELLEDSLRIFRAEGDRIGEAGTLLCIGRAYILDDQPFAAIEHCERALGAVRYTSNVVAEGEIMLELSSARLKLGQADAAISNACAAVELCREAGNRLGEAQAIAALGEAEYATGSVEHARMRWIDAHGRLTRLGHPQAAEIRAKLDGLKSA
jgi:tetratricopeptide (TPR) repeat protein